MAADPDDAVDFVFLAAQTLDDVELQREVLALFVAQGRRVIATLPRLGPREQADAAHLLKGSARGIGAWRAATAAEAYEGADPDARHRLEIELAAAFCAAAAAIEAHPLLGT